MQERQVTVDGVARPLAAPFFVIATQNPIEQDGTFPLPGGPARPLRAAARARLSGARRRGAHAGRPDRRPRARRSRRWRPSPMPARSSPPCTPAARVHVAPALHDYVVALCGATREDARLALGASPRAGVTLVRLARAHALVRGRDHVLPGRRQGARARRARAPVCCRRPARRRTSRRSSTSCSRGCPSRCERGGGPAALTARGRAALACGLAAVAYARLFGTAEHRAARGGARGCGRCSRASGSALAGGAARRGAQRCPRSRTPASACASRSSCGRWRARVPDARRSRGGARAGLRAAARHGRWAARPARQLRARAARARRARARRRRCSCARIRSGSPGARTRRAASTALTVLAPPLELEDERARRGRRGVAFARQRLRSGGHELHGVREHQPGESLRGVHWPATAHHGRLDGQGARRSRRATSWRSCSTRAPRSTVGRPPDSSFELAVAAAGALVDARVRRVAPRAARRRRRDGEPGERERAHAPCAGCSRACGRRASDLPRSCSARLAAERIEVVTSRPGGARRRAGRWRQLGVVAIDPSSFDPAVAARRRRARGAARRGLRACSSCGARSGSPRRPAARRAGRALGLRGALYALGRGASACCTRATCRCLRSRRSGLAAIAALASAPALVGAARSAGGSALLALAPAALAAAWVAAGRWPRRRSPLGGLAGPARRCARDLGQVVLPFARGEHPELRALVLLALFAWLAALALALARAAAPARRGAASPRCPSRSARPSTTCRSSRWRATRRGCPAVRVPAHRARRRAAAVHSRPAFAALALAAGAGWAAVPAASQPAVAAVDDLDVLACRPRRHASSLVWDMRYRPLAFPPKPVEVLQVRAPRASYWRAVVLADFDGLRFSRALQGDRRRRAAGGSLRVPAPSPGARAACRGAGRGARRLVPRRPRASPCATRSRPAGPVDLARTRPRSSASTPAAGSRLRRRGRRSAIPTAARCGACRRRYPARDRGGGLRLRRAVDARVRRAGRERAMAAMFPPHRARPGVERVAGRLREGARRHARRGVALPGRRRARGVAAHLARLRRARVGLPRSRRMRSRAGRPPGRPATARCSPPRWPRSRASPACLRASPRASRPATGATASSTSPTATRTPGSRRGSRATAGCRSTRRPGARCPSGHRPPRPRSTARRPRRARRRRVRRAGSAAAAAARAPARRRPERGARARGAAAGGQVAPGARRPRCSRRRSQPACWQARAAAPVAPARARARCARARRVPSRRTRASTWGRQLTPRELGAAIERRFGVGARRLRGGARTLRLRGPGGERRRRARAPRPRAAAGPARARSGASAACAARSRCAAQRRARSRAMTMR